MHILQNIHGEIHRVSSINFRKLPYSQFKDEIYYPFAPENFIQRYILSK